MKARPRVGCGLRRWTLAMVVVLSGVAMPLPVLAQDDVPAWAKGLVKDPDGPEMRAYREQQKKRLALEKELKKFRSDYFRTARPKEVRAKAIEQLKQYTDPETFPTLVEIFKTEGLDVRLALLDHFAAQASDEGDVTLAWVGVFDSSKEVRLGAARRLKERMTGKKEVPNRVQWVLYEGLVHGNEDAIAASATLINLLNVVEAIPFLINAQVGLGGGGGDSGGERSGALAWIFVGTQTSYVSDLTPVVSESAVGFDPTVDVLSEGTLLKVMDAQVVVYRGAVRQALTDMVTRESGLSTAHLGWGAKAWNEWYAKTFVPAMGVKKAERAKEQAKAAGGEPVVKPAVK